MKPPRVPEKVVQRHVLAALAAIGAKSYVLGTVRPRGDTPGTRQTPGISDIIAFLPVSPDGRSAGHLLCIEVKAKGGRLRPEQADFARRCAECGIAHLVGGLDVVLAYLQQHGYVREYPAQYRRTA